MADARPAAPADGEPEAGEIKRRIAQRARDLGFDVVGFARAEAEPRHQRDLSSFLRRGYHGEMAWMAETASRRADPRVLWPDARSIIALGVNYGPAEDPLQALARHGRGAISVYAKGRDYHDVIKKRLKRLAREIARDYDAEVKVFVDTAPVMEKPYAERAGLGWQGKHTNLVSRSLGSWLFLGEIFTALDLPPDAPEADHCGRCRRCHDVCPTDAFPAPYQLDARRCISYLTIEHKGHIPPEFRAAIGNRIFGCDDCLAVCPWNKFAQRTRELAFRPRAELIAPRLADLAALSDEAFRALFAGSPIKRIGRARFVRNVLIALGNAGEPAFAAVAERRLEDESPLVRAMAVWALGRLSTPARLARLRERHLSAECDPAVRAEWHASGDAGGRPDARGSSIGGDV